MERGVVPGKLLAELLKSSRLAARCGGEFQCDFNAAAKKMSEICGVREEKIQYEVNDLTDNELSLFFASATNEEMFNVFRAVGWTVTDEEERKEIQVTERGVVPKKQLAELFDLARAYHRTFFGPDTANLAAAKEKFFTAQEKLADAAMELGKTCSRYGILDYGVFCVLTDPDGLFADATNEELFNVFRAAGWRVTGETKRKEA